MTIKYPNRIRGKIYGGTVMKTSVIRSLAALLALVFSMSLLTMPVLGGNLDTGGTLRGKHYNINIIGVPNAKNVNFDGGEGNRIFVLRTGMTTFYVHGGTSFEILDCDGTDGYIGWSREAPGIIFPYNVTTGEWLVQIYIRLLGPIDSSLRWTTKVWNGTAYALAYQFTINRDRPPKFQLKTGQLLVDDYQDILWELDQKTSFRILQMRIYLEPV